MGKAPQCHTFLPHSRSFLPLSASVCGGKGAWSENFLNGSRLSQNLLDPHMLGYGKRKRQLKGGKGGWGKDEGEPDLQSPNTHLVVAPGC